MLFEQSVMLSFEPQIGVASAWQENLGGSCVPIDLLEPAYDADFGMVGLLDVVDLGPILFLCVEGGHLRIGVLVAQLQALAWFGGVVSTWRCLVSAIGYLTYNSVGGDGDDVSGGGIALAGVNHLTEVRHH